MYSGKARAYLGKQGIAFSEVMPGDPAFSARIVPKTKRGIVPVIELGDGTVIQDTVDIIDYFEGQPTSSFSVYPTTPRQRIAALLLDLFGSEGMLKVAMHYRWNFPQHNYAFLRMEFGDHIAPGAEPKVVKQAAEAVMAPMKAYLPMLGINSETIPAIEAQYLELLALLNAHFAKYPYLLGGRPSVADYGLMAPLYAHLSRDPYPSAIMKSHAQRVYRWVERMNAENDDTPEHPGHTADYLAGDAVPETLQNILKLVARDFLPELKLAVSTINDWLVKHPDVEGQCVTEKPRIKALCSMRYPFRGSQVEGLVIPYQLYMLQRITDFYSSCSNDERPGLEKLYSQLGLREVLTLTAKRRVERPGLIEVWGKTT